MADFAGPTPETLRAARIEKPKARDRDLAESLGATEAQLTAAHIGEGVTRITAAPSRILPEVARLGEVMALTRNDSCVHERVGAYSAYHEGPHAGIILGEDIDLRIFPKEWVHAFAVEKMTEDGPRRSLQVFDAAGDSIHKIHLRATSNHDEWASIVERLRVEDQSDVQAVTARRPVEGPKGDVARTEELRQAWAEMTDTHQFLGLVKKVEMNRLGAYRLAGDAWVRQLDTGAVDLALEGVRDAGVGIMVFVGNRGCIQIHSGPLEKLVPMGPWSNVMDPKFNMHLRRDHIAEVWAVTKPTDRGPAISVEAFDADGMLILQLFPIPKADKDSRPEWAAIVAGLPSQNVEEVA